MTIQPESYTSLDRTPGSVFFAFAFCDKKTKTKCRKKLESIAIFSAYAHLKICISFIRSLYFYRGTIQIFICRHKGNVEC